MRLSPLFLSLLLPAVAAAQSESPCWIQDAASPANGQAVLLCDHEKVILSDGSLTKWRSVRLPVPTKLRAMAFRDARHAFIVGDGGLLLESMDGGSTWRKAESPTNETLTAIRFSGDLGWIAGYGGVVLRTEDGGKTWTALKTKASVSLEDVYFTDSEYGWAVGWGGAMVRTKDGGKTWESVKAPVAMWSLNSVYFKDRDNGWVAGMFGLLLHTKDGGKTWEKQVAPPNNSIRSILFDKSGRGWITAENHILTSTDGGSSWKTDWSSKLAFLHTVKVMGDSMLAVGPFSVKVLEDGKWKDVNVFPKSTS